MGIYKFEEEQAGGEVAGGVQAQKPQAAACQESGQRQAGKGDVFRQEYPDGKRECFGYYL